MNRSLHNLGTVIGFEIIRTLRRASFWLTALAIPLFMMAVMWLSMFSGSAAARSEIADSTKPIAFTYTDASGLVDPAIAAKHGGTPTQDAAAARAAVVSGSADLFIAFPADPSTDPIEVAGRDRGLTGGDSYTSTARKVLEQSAQAKVTDPRVAHVLARGPDVQKVTYADGKVAPGWASVVLPGAFLVLFYVAIVLLGNQMLNITVEEKENRVTEMILTTINPTTLILGKIIALLLVGVIQGVVTLLPLLLLPRVFTSAVGPATEGAEIPELPAMAELATAINPPAIAWGAAFFLASFMLFTGVLLSIGAVMPSAKDAGQAFGVVVICLFLPMYVMGLIMSDPHGVVSQIMTFFPLTAPVTAMARNAVGTLYPWEAALALALITLAAVGFMALGIRLFRTGSISYNARLNIGKALRSNAAR